MSSRPSQSVSCLRVYHRPATELASKDRGRLDGSCFAQARRAIRDWIRWYTKFLHIMAALVAALSFIVPELRRIAGFLQADEERGEAELRRRLRRLLLVARVENLFLILIVLDMVMKPL